MQAIRLHATGGPQSLVVDEVPVPVPGAGDVLVRLRAAALNHRDVFITRGLYPNIELPRILGADGMGVLDGSRVVIDPMLGWGDDPAVWDPNATILGMPRDGTFAQFIAVPKENVHPAPAHLSDAEAAALPLAGLTAYRATFTRAKLERGETVLITGIGGGVQSFVLLFAKHIGARTVVTSSSDEKLERAKAMGADIAINYKTTPDWHKAARKAAGTIDAAIDSAGGDAFAKATSIVRPGGRVVTYGGTSGDATIKLFPIFWNHVTIYGTSMGSPQDFRGMIDLFADALLRPTVDAVLPMRDAATAATRMENADQFGKIVLEIP
ncbi:MAG: zinc-binding dehydrogenase [Candidatus Eremiobacteraeota bacterium]|nr:zinc-binding dehydrogenase [Candidatus Eremiobacteraeota bacterium]